MTQSTPVPKTPIAEPTTSGLTLEGSPSVKPTPSDGAMAAEATPLETPAVANPRDEAERNLNVVQDALGRVNRIGLSNQDAARLKAAESLASSARRAFDDHDYAATEGLTAKADVVIGALPKLQTPMLSPVPP
ncbi:MAG TPA: hypothetical protein VKS22_10525 [Candidatus Binataceae bacterium]|nr:hypothetical protein [Candidatus Binataceae bacterium]